MWVSRRDDRVAGGSMIGTQAGALDTAAAVPARALALECLLEADVTRKCAMTRRHAQAIRDADTLDIDPRHPPVVPLAVPGRPDRPLLVAPRDLVQRKLSSAEGRAALIHAVAHIEFNAINLAWDAVYRYPGMPESYYRDWASVADDEARHFALLSERLGQLGYAYGDFSAHNGLWSMAVATAADVLERMALVPRVLEARGLDVTPGMIERLRGAGDLDTVACLDVILAEEVRHVAIGSHWFKTLCAQRQLDPSATFQRLVASHGLSALRGPLNITARMQAGFDAAELQQLTANAANA